MVVLEAIAAWLTMISILAHEPLPTAYQRVLGSRPTPVEMTFEQTNVALVGLKIQVKNRTQDGYAADDCIERDVAEHSRDYAVPGTVLSRSHDNVE